MSQQNQMNLNVAINILVQGVITAQKRGAYELTEASQLSQAVQFVLQMSEHNKKQIQQQQVQQQQVQQPIPLAPIEEDETLII